MRVCVDANRCQGHTLCNRVAPQVFKLRAEDGHSYVEQPEVPKEFEAAVRRAAQTCPEEAISVEESSDE